MPESIMTPVEVPEGESPAAHGPNLAPKEPSTRAPVGACDAHVHIIAGPSEFELWEHRSEDPAKGRSFDDWLSLYRSHLDTLGCTRGVVVQSILYGADNSVTIEALRRLGEGFRGVGLVTEDVQDDTLDNLARHRIAAVRLNYVHGGLLSWERAQEMAPRLAERGMHLEMLLHADRHMEELAEAIARSPVPVVIDHCGWPSDGSAEGPGVRALCRLLEADRAWVKLSGVYRFARHPYEAAAPLVRALVEANPERCVWGSDWPHLMLGGAEMPDAGVLFDFLMDTIGDAEVRQRILVENPARLYGF